MFDFLDPLFDTTSFPARWTCGLWTEFHGWIHIVSDIAIFGAYFTIPIVLAYFITKHRGLPYSPVIWLFAAFILSCGIGHLLEAIIFWHPMYRVAGVVKVVTATVSWGTVFALVPIVPKALKLPGLAVVNKQLKAEIAERKRMEQERDRIFELSVDAMCIANVDGFFKRINPAFTRIFGWTEEEFLSRPMTEFVHPDDRESTAAEIERLSRGEPTLHFENRYRCKDGGWKTIAWRCNPQPDGNLYATGRDITEQKQQEEKIRKFSEELEGLVGERTRELASSEAKFRALAAHSAEAEKTAHYGSFDLDLDSRTFVWSDELYRICGRDPKRFNPTFEAFMEQIHPDDRKSVEAAFSKAIEAIGTFQIEKRILLPGNQVRLLESHGRVIASENDRPVRVVGVCQDITERKQTEAKNQALESELRQTHKMQAIGTLAGGIAHDFNNILGSLLGNAELALMEADNNEEVKESLDHILKGIHRATDLVDQILSFSRHEEPKFGPIDIRKPVNEAIGFLRSTIPATIEINTNFECPHFKVYGDSTQIYQVIVNLGSNAAHAVSADKGSIDFGMKSVFAGDVSDEVDGLREGVRYVKLTVQDNGTGIDEAVIERIFEPFFTTKEVGSGTGLGLSVVHGIVNSHEGVIDVCSSRGEGTTFDVFFPECDIESEEVHSSPAMRETPGTEREGHRILIVDDDLDLLASLERILGKLGYSVSTTANPKTALEKIYDEGHSFDLLITDFAMPDMDGWELAQLVEERFPKMPIVLLSGYMESEKANNFKIACWSRREVLRKPIETRNLCLVIDRLVSAAAREVGKEL